MYKTYQRGKEKWSLVLSFTDDKGLRKQDSSFSDTDSIPTRLMSPQGGNTFPSQMLNNHVRTSLKHKSNKFRHPQVWRKSCEVQTKREMPPVVDYDYKGKGTFYFLSLYWYDLCNSISCIRSPNMRRHRLRGLGSGGAAGSPSGLRSEDLVLKRCIIVT